MRLSVAAAASERATWVWCARKLGAVKLGGVSRYAPLAPLRGRVTLERFASASHALVSPRGQPGGIVDDVLKQHGIPRRIAFTTPSFLVAPQVVAMTDLVMMLPARIAAALQAQLRLATFEPPLEVPGFRMAMFWHDRHDSDPAHAFIRREIAQVAAALPTPASLTRRRTRRRRVDEARS
jgi:DNA-binding transcriptional LysR family regulator